MTLKNVGLGALALGVLIAIVAFAQDTAPEGTHNLGLLQSQMMLLHAGLALALGGGVTAAIGTVVNRMEQAGLLPPAGVMPTLGEKPGSGDA